MGFFKKLNQFFTRAQTRSDKYYVYQVKCKRCGEIIEGRVDVDNDLSIEYKESGDIYHCRKVLMGAGRCYQQIEVSFTFSSSRRLTEQTISGGEFVEA